MNTPSNIGEQFLREITEELARDVPVRRDLPRGGHLHIDRRLPFLCVYRGVADTADTGTGQLLTSQAAYLVTYPGAISEAALGALIGTLVASQSAQFGAFLLLEIWAADSSDGEPPPQGFRIVAPDLHAPQTLLESMESALLRVGVGEEPPGIRLDYQPEPGRPGMAPLLTREQLRACQCTLLEVNPAYRDPATGELFVFFHKAFRRKFGHALKRCFYEFTHEHTTHRPAHYHELGPRSVTRSSNRVDARLAEISGEFDLLLFVSPINTAAAWQEFQRHNCDRGVEFLYRPRTIDPDLLKRRLFRIAVEKVEDPTLAHIFTAKRDELDRQVTLLSDRNTPRFLLGSRQLFGDVSPRLLQLARDILERLPPSREGEPDGEVFDAEQFAVRAREEVDYYREQDPTLACEVNVRDDIPGIMVSHGNFLIGANAHFRGDRLQATLAHEIGTHALTYHNGRQQPLQELRVGMAGYETFQEGLAVLSEYLVGELDAERLRQLAGRVLAVHMITEGADFVDTFRSLHRLHGFYAEDAFMMTMRVYRGGGYTKDAVYLQGLVQILDYLANGKDLKLLYLGKIAHEYLPLVEELRWRQVLRESVLLPRLFSLRPALNRLERLCRGMTVLDLIEGVD